MVTWNIHVAKSARYALDSTVMNDNENAIYVKRRKTIYEVVFMRWVYVGTKLLAVTFVHVDDGFLIVYDLLNLTLTLYTDENWVLPEIITFTNCREKALVCIFIIH